MKTKTMNYEAEDTAEQDLSYPFSNMSMYKKRRFPKTLSKYDQTLIQDVTKHLRFNFFVKIVKSYYLFLKTRPH